MASIMGVTPIAYCPLCSVYIYEWGNLSSIANDELVVHDTWNCGYRIVQLLDRPEVAEKWVQLWT